MTHLTATLPPDVGAPATARRDLAAMLVHDHIEPNLIDEALIVLSELVTNAVVHARSSILVHAELDHRLLHLEVVDDSVVAPRRHIPDDDDGGWGLNLVEHLTTEWGFGPREDGREGKVVWVNLPLGAGDA
jgi:anti-sigma regulatory factor (Ser/Thr protein kinase)